MNFHILTSNSYFKSDFLSELAATVVCAQPFALYCAVIALSSYPTALQWSHADPILKIFPPNVSIWGVIILSIVLSGCAFRFLGHRYLLEHVHFKTMLAGVAVAVVSTLAIRLLVGQSLPAFIPPEESAKPGFLLGMVAGYGEEVIFRMGLTPVVFFACRRVLPQYLGDARRIWISAIISVGVTAVMFALAHELGAPDVPVDWFIFATRVLVPGLLMGSLYFLIGPGFVIFMHSAAHIMIPILFV